MNLREEIIKGPFTENRARRVFYSLIKVLNKIHQSGRVAYDLRSNQITIRETEIEIPYSITCTIEEYKSRDYPAYASPESILGNLSQSDDVWAAGVILYQMLTCAYPFYAENQTDIVCKIIVGAFVLPNASVDACILIRSMLGNKRPTFEQVLNCNWFERLRSIDLLYGMNNLKLYD